MVRRDPVRLISWNLWWLFGAPRVRAGPVDAVLDAVRPDVCVLQEVTPTDAERIAADRGMTAVVVASPRPGRWQRRADAPGRDIANAILSRWAVLGAAGLRLPAGGEADEGRTAVWVLLDAPGGPVLVVGTQLNSAPHHSAVRCGQVRALATAVAEGADAGPVAHPVVLAGDLNAEPDSDEVRLLCGHKTAPVVPGHVLVDAWRWADPGDPGWTWDRRNPHVAATGEPSARIDHVLVGPPTSDGRGAVLGARLAGNAPVEGVWPSDHAAVVVDLAG